MSVLAWLGARAQWVLAIGVVSALFIPGPGALLAGTLPFWVALLMGLAMMRIDLGAVALGALAPRRLALTLGVAAGLLLLTPTTFWLIGQAIGLPPQLLAALVLTGAAPPLGSGAAFCLMIGFNAAFAIELTVLCSLLVPVTMPLITRLLLGDAVPVETFDMAIRLGILIGAAAGGAILGRLLLGAERIDRLRLPLDGISSVILVIFLFPLFEGLLGQMISAPGLALGTLALAAAANLGVQMGLFAPLRRLSGFATGGASALIAGNRNAALSLASTPPDPILTLYVALYQFPMYFTPLVMGRVAGPPPERVR